VHQSEREREKKKERKRERERKRESVRKRERESIVCRHMDKLHSRRASWTNFSVPALSIPAGVL
jgi:hypothetical protein